MARAIDPESDENKEALAEELEAIERQERGEPHYPLSQLLEEMKHWRTGSSTQSVSRERSKT